MSAPFDPSALLVALEDSLRDSVLSDDERRALAHAVRSASPPEDGVRQLRNHAFALARRHADGQPDPAPMHALLKWLEGAVRALDVARAPAGAPLRSQAHFSPGSACLLAIQAELQGARHSVDVCVFTLSDDRISQALMAAHGRGVAVRLITDNDKELDSGSDVGRLRQQGIPTRVDRSAAHMHHKFAIVDGRTLLNGSYNWTRSAAEHNEENLVVTNDAMLVAPFRDAFEHLWGQLGG